MTLDPARRTQIAKEAKSIVALSFRNGTIEDVRAGRPCPVCAGRIGYSRISDEEMRVIMRNAVDQVYRLLVLKVEDPEEYERNIRFGCRYTQGWAIRRPRRLGYGKPYINRFEKVGLGTR